MTSMCVELVDECAHELAPHLVLFELRADLGEALANQSMLGSERASFAWTHATERWDHELILSVKMDCQCSVELLP